MKAAAYSFATLIIDSRVIALLNIGRCGLVRWRRYIWGGLLKLYRVT